jgi:imidazoleglycerol phosphate dehydratase HisB
MKTKSTIQSDYPNVHEAIVVFQTVQSKYDDTGAYDTEPDTQFQMILADAIESKPLRIEGWAIFDDHPQYEAASKALDNAARKAYNEVYSKLNRLRSRDTKDAFIKAVKGYCWRVY